MAIDGTQVTIAIVGCVQTIVLAYIAFRTRKIDLMAKETTAQTPVLNDVHRLVNGETAQRKIELANMTARAIAAESALAKIAEATDPPLQQ